MIDTINSAYNYNARLKLDNEYVKKEQELEELQKKFLFEIDKAMENGLTDKEIDNIENKYDELIGIKREEEHKAWLKCFAAQFPKTRNKWFCGVIENFANDGKDNNNWFYISERQFDCFSQFCKEYRDTWRSNKSYCRCGDYFITLWRLCGRKYSMKVTLL